MNNNYLIVVGVDGSDGVRRALDWAVREAGRRGGAVQAVSAWSWDGTQFGPIIATNPREAEEYARKIVDGEVAEMVRRHGSSVPLSGRVLEGRPADALGSLTRAGQGPPHAEILYQLARCQGAVGQTDAAVASAQRALAVDATHQPSRQLIAELASRPNAEPAVR